MNIFAVDNNPEAAARSLCDKHVVKMILETAQMLCAAFPNGDAPYRRTHYNHPSSRWARETQGNYKWLLKHGYWLADEYHYRYQKIHKSLEVIQWCDDHSHTLEFQGGPERTPFAQAMPEQYKNESAIQAYRDYYNAEKAAIAKWTRRSAPEWFQGTKKRVSNEGHPL